MGILHAFWSTCWLTMFSSDLTDRRHCTMDGKPRKRGGFHAWHSRRLNAHSPSVSRLALPPAAVVSMVKTFSVARRRSEEHTYEFQSLMRTPYAAFGSKKRPQH